MGEDGGRLGVLSQWICHCFQRIHLLPTDALVGKGLLNLTKASLVFEIIWISVEVFEATPSLPWPGSALPAEHPCHGGQLDLCRKNLMFSSRDLSPPKANYHH